MSDLRLAMDGLAALAAIIERAPVDDVHLTKGLALAVAGEIRTVLAALAAAPAGDGEDDRFWLIVREPGMVPDRKGPFRHTDTAKVLREFMAANPRAFIDHLTVDTDGTPWVDHGPEVLQMTDGRSMSVGRRHNARVRDAAEAALTRPRAAVGERAWDGVVATDPCQSADDTDEDGNPCWYIEIQSVGGHSIVATIWGGSPEEVQSRANAILALQSPPAKVEG